MLLDKHQDRRLGGERKARANVRHGPGCGRVRRAGLQCRLDDRAIVVAVQQPRTRTSIARILRRACMPTTLVPRPPRRPSNPPGPSASGTYPYSFPCDAGSRAARFGESAPCLCWPLSLSRTPSSHPKSVVRLALLLESQPQIESPGIRVVLVNL